MPRQQKKSQFLQIKRESYFLSFFFFSLSLKDLFRTLKGKHTITSLVRYHSPPVVKASVCTNVSSTRMRQELTEMPLTADRLTMLSDYSSDSRKMTDETNQSNHIPQMDTEQTLTGWKSFPISCLLELISCLFINTHRECSIQC